MTRDALYVNLDLTLTTMERPFDALVVATLKDAGFPDELIDATAHSNRFFDHFLALDDDPMVRAYEETFDAHDVDPDLSPEEAAQQQAELEVGAVSPVADGLPELVADLREAFTVGVLTSGLSDLQRAKLDVLGLADAFDDVVISYEVGATKADGSLFAAAEDRTDADRYAYLSTHGSDLEQAAAAGWVPIDCDPADLAEAEDPVAVVRSAIDG